MSRHLTSLSAAILTLSLAGFLGASGEDLRGATRVVEELANTPTTTPAQHATQVAEQAWRERLHTLQRDSSTLAPETAATRWLDLLDEWRQLARSDTENRTPGHDLPPMLEEWCGALPGPEAWEFLLRATGSRVTAPGTTSFDHALYVLAATLHGDHTAALAALERWSDSLPPDVQMPVSGEIASWLRERRDPAGAFLSFYERTLAEASAAGFDFFIPDLVSLRGDAEARRMLAHTLATARASLRIAVDNPTRRLVLQLAQQNIATLPRPQWSLITATTADDRALYEAMLARFPEPPTHEARVAQAEAQQYHVLGLLADGRTDEAVRLLASRQRLVGVSNEPVAPRVLDGLPVSAAHGSLRDVLRRELERDPAQPGWETFLAVSARLGETPEAIAFLRATRARSDLEAETHRRIEAHLWTTLLASDDTAVAGALMRDRLRTDCAALTPPTGHEAPAAINWSESCDLAIQLARLGLLLEETAWIDEGLAAAHAIFDARPGSITIESRGALIEILLDLGRTAEAEASLVRWWAQARRTNGSEPDLRRSDDEQFLTLLITTYDRAGRGDDVLQLLTGSPDWPAATLAGLDDAIKLCAARALIARGRPAEARPILADLQRNDAGADPVYALWLAAAGADVAAEFDALYACDRFEERPLIWRAIALRQAGRLPEAEACARAAITLDPSDGEQPRGDRMRAYAVLADICADRGDAREASRLRSIVDAVRRAEGADQFWAAGLRERAVRLYDAALTTFADAYCIQARLAVRAAELGQLARAEEHFLRAFELMPDSFGYIESHCFGCEGAFHGPRAQTAAERVLDALAVARPDKAQVHYLRGVLRSHQGRDLDAVANFRRAVALEPDYLNAWRSLDQLADEVAMPPAEREVVALAMLRLDPAQRHHGGTPWFGPMSGNSRYAPNHQIADFRALWPLLERAGRCAPTPTRSYYPLTATAAAINHERLAGTGSPRSHGKLDDLRAINIGDARTPGAGLLRHPVIARELRLLAQCAQQ